MTASVPPLRIQLAHLSQIGNAESAHFTSDVGLNKGDVNTAVALFFAFFVTLQPVGAALGRRYGMVAWVPSCMLLWGISTALHAWVRHRWQLYTLRIIIGCLEGTALSPCVPARPKSLQLASTPSPSPTSPSSTRASSSAAASPSSTAKLPSEVLSVES